MKFLQHTSLFSTFTEAKHYFNHLMEQEGARGGKINQFNYDNRDNYRIYIFFDCPQDLGCGPLTESGDFRICEVPPTLMKPSGIDNPTFNVNAQCDLLEKPHGIPSRFHPILLRLVNSIFPKGYTIETWDDKLINEYNLSDALLNEVFLDFNGDGDRTVIHGGILWVWRSTGLMRAYEIGGEWIMPETDGHKIQDWIVSLSVFPAHVPVPNGRAAKAEEAIDAFLYTSNI